MIPWYVLAMVLWYGGWRYRIIGLGLRREPFVGDGVVVVCRE